MQLYPDPVHQPFQLGSGDAGALLIHGFPGTPAEVRPLGERLAAAGYAAHGLLLPGFGSDIQRLSQMGKAEWLAAVQREWQAMRHHHTQRILVGYSMGGALALQLAAHSPPDYLILLSPFWRMNHWLGRFLPLLKYLKPTVSPFDQADFDDPALRAHLHQIMPNVDLESAAVQARLRQEMSLPTAILDDVRSLGTSAYRLAADIHCPTLVIQAADDDTVLPAHTQKLVRRLPHVTYHCMPGGHDFVKAEGRYTSLVLDFLPTLPQQSALEEMTA